MSVSFILLKIMIFVSANSSNPRQSGTSDRTRDLIIHDLLYLHGLTLRILKKKIVGQMLKISFASKESK